MVDDSSAEKTSPPLYEIARRKRVIWGTVGLVLLTALLLVALWEIPKWQVAHVDLTPKDRFASEDEARKTLATILGGIVVLGGAYFTWRNIRLTQESVATAQKALMVSQEGQITDRFTKAIDQLGAVDDSGTRKKLEVRLGGIYALEGIANESKELHWPIMEVLCTYVRVNAPIKPENSPSGEQKPEKPVQNSQASASAVEPAADILAILRVLSRRDRKSEREGQILDLTLTCIRGADLSSADLSAANLSCADLGRAMLYEADLSGANLSGANLCEANLNAAHLNKANLSFADLIGTDLIAADLSGADLTDARGLTQRQIDLANGDGSTKLPDNLHVPDRWKK